jgi:AmmeMemoRadiSam system protein A
MTSASERLLLLALARDAIASCVNRTAAPQPPDCPAALEMGGAFVSLHRDDSLRGCIGHIEPDLPRGIVVARCAVQACSADPRFPPVTVGELGYLHIELSLLGPLEPFTDIEEIEIGRHGLVVEDGWNRGLLLPQVATELGWDREAFLVQTCRKAGLAHDAWRRGARLWRFAAEVFGER